jgi:E3 ubiquitin-protein ligase RNF115/126
MEQAREMVYCHECENEWYRDEHGLTCPECQSDFVEVIEQDHDPREDEMHIPADPARPAGTQHQHEEFYGGAPDPDEVSATQWER